MGRLPESGVDPDYASKPKRIHIGDVAVHRGMPPDGNPYRQGSLMGDERAAALYAWRDGEPTDGFTFWYAPFDGGAYQLFDSSRVRWDG